MAEKKKVPVEFIDVTDPDYKEHHVTDAYGGFVPQGVFSMTLFDTHVNEHPKDKEKIRLVRTKKVRLVFSPISLKIIYDWLSKHVDKIQVGRKDDEDYKGGFSATPIKPP